MTAAGRRGRALPPIGALFGRHLRPRVCLAFLVLTSALRLPDDPHMSSQPIEYRWRGPVTDAEMVMLVQAHGGRPVAGWWDQVRPYSLG